MNDYIAGEINAIVERIADKVSDVGALRALATRAILAGTPLDAFRAQALAMLPSCQPARPAEPLAVKPKDWGRYSLARAIRMSLPDGKRDGIEQEVSQELSLKGGRKPEGIWVPREVMQGNAQRNYLAGTGTLGGNLVETSNLGAQFVGLLRNRPMVAQLGARQLALSNPVTIPKHVEGGTVNWVGETVAATLSTGNFSQITLTPHGLSAFQQFGRQLLSESDPGIDQIIRDDIMAGLALEIDRAILHGTGGDMLTGITAQTGVTTLTLGANGAAFTVANGRASMVSLETALASSNADQAACAYLTNSAVRGRLKMIDENQTTAAASWVWKQTPQGSTVNGYRAEVSNQVSKILTMGTATTLCSSVYFADWSQAVIATFNNGAVDLISDPYVLAVNSVIRVIARTWVDWAPRHPESFAVLLGVLDS